MLRLAKVDTSGAKVLLEGVLSKSLLPCGLVFISESQCCQAWHKDSLLFKDLYEFGSRQIEHKHSIASIFCPAIQSGFPAETSQVFACGLLLL